MNNPHRINDAYSTFFKDWLSSQLTPSKAAYFVTITFEHEAQRRRRRQAEGLSAGAFEMKSLDHLYNMISRKIVGRNYNRAASQHRLPVVAAFLDTEGTKFWRCRGEFSNLHFHSIWIVGNEDCQSFKEMLKANGSLADKWRDLSVDQIDCQAIDLTDEHSFDRVVAYASKAIGFDTAQLSMGAGFAFYPQSA
jgi:hypothetical protein